LNVVGFVTSNSYIALNSWPVTSNGSLTFNMRSSKSHGIVAYYGDEKSHIAVELYDGRVKVSFYIGNYPPSHLYSYDTGTSFPQKYH
jgi:hypothetical protein